MIIDVVYERDYQARREARNCNPPGRTVGLKHRFTTHEMIGAITAQTDGVTNCISILRFHHIPFVRIFDLPPYSALNGGGNARATTPEEDSLMSLNNYFVAGRAAVYFYRMGLYINETFLENPALRRKLWSRVSIWSGGR